MDPRFEINVQIYEKKSEKENPFCFIKIFVFLFWKKEDRTSKTGGHAIHL